MPRSRCTSMDAASDQRTARGAGDRVPGDHRVELRTADGRVRDSAVFTVRGL